MPTYTFRDVNTNEIHEKFFNIQSKEDYLQSNPQLEQIILVAPPIGDSIRMGLKGTDDGFKEVLSKIHEKNYKSNLDNKLSR